MKPINNNKTDIVITSIGLGAIGTVVFGVVLWLLSDSSLLVKIVYLGISWTIFSLAAYSGQESG